MFATINPFICLAADAILLTDTLDKFRGVSPETSVSPVSAAQKSRAQHGGKHE